MTLRSSTPGHGPLLIGTIDSRACRSLHLPSAGDRGERLPKLNTGVRFSSPAPHGPTHHGPAIPRRLGGDTPESGTIEEGRRILDRELDELVRSDQLSTLDRQQWDGTRHPFHLLDSEL